MMIEDETSQFATKLSQNRLAQHYDPRILLTCTSASLAVMSDRACRTALTASSVCVRWAFPAVWASATNVCFLG